MYDTVVCGAGLAGCTAARLLADKGEKVLVIEKLPHIGGSVYDFCNGAGVLVHKYGPHIFHTNNEAVYAFLSRFTCWNDYEHRVLAYVNGEYIPVPFNSSAMEKTFGLERAKDMIKLAKEKFGTDTVSIMKLKEESGDEELKALGEYVFENVFLHYTMKQWEKKPSEIDPQTTARVPVRFTDDDRYFTDKYQGLPYGGYTAMTERMLAHPGITVRTGTDALDLITLKDGKTYFEGKETDARIVYTGRTDLLFGNVYGALPYRTLDFVFETHPADSFQPAATVNYTVSEDYTRITEFKKLTGQLKRGVTTIMKEYPKAFTGKEGEIPYYPVASDESRALFGKYLDKSGEYKNLVLLGRLAEYKYYNMDAVVARAMEVLG